MYLNGGILDNGYATTPQDYYLIQLPIIRLFYAGHFQVHIFFIMSGYIISLTPLRLIRSQKQALLLQWLSSACFRRAFRLYVPIIVSQFIFWIAVYYGYYSVDYADGGFRQGRETLWLQLKDFFHSVSEELNPFRWDQHQPPYLPSLWSVVVEFRCSLVVYITLLTFANTRSTIRLSFLCLFLCYAVQIHMLEISAFLYGMILAEASIIHRESDFDIHNHVSQYTTPGFIQRARAIFWIMATFFSLWLGTYPGMLGSETWGYGWVSLVTPSIWNHDNGGRLHFANFVGAAILLTALENFTPLQRPFTTSIAQYLGKISFAIYITHEGLSYTINHFIARRIFNYFSNYITGFCIAMPLISFITIWGADIFWRLVDLRSIKMAKDIKRWSEIK
jgi:peptidoglycan/LPS O-acetylase OafA/YrhL